MSDVALDIDLRFSRSVGAGSATTRNTRGLTRSVKRLMTPPLPSLRTAELGGEGSMSGFEARAGLRQLNSSGNAEGIAEGFECNWSHSLETQTIEFPKTSEVSSLDRAFHSCLRLGAR